MATPGLDSQATSGLAGISSPFMLVIGPACTNAPDIVRIYRRSGSEIIVLGATEVCAAQAQMPPMMPSYVPVRVRRAAASRKLAPRWTPFDRALFPAPPPRAAAPGSPRRTPPRTWASTLRAFARRS